MPSRLEPIYKDTYYHVYNRGFNKQKLFYEDKDYQRCLDKLRDYLIEFDRIHIVSYCLLPNHFHFLLYESSTCLELPRNKKTKIKSDLMDESLEAKSPEEAIQVSRFMMKIQQSYALYFHEKYKDTLKKGLKMPMFEGRFKAKEVFDEGYLGYLGTYIECNAAKHSIVDHPKDWKYSSFDRSKEIILWSKDKDVFDPDFD